MRLVIVEDSEDLRECLCEAFRLAGHEVLEAADYCAAKGLLLSRPDAVLSDGDFGLNAASPPARFGPVLCREAEELGIPAVLYTGSPALVDAERLAGRQAFLKPTPIKTLLAAFASEEVPA